MNGAQQPLRGISVVELGDRIAVGACASVLAALGADVLLIEPQEGSTKDWTSGKWSVGEAVRVGKRAGSMASAQLASALRNADVVLLSTDVSGPPGLAAPATSIICDITAYGTSGPLAGRPDTDALVQAVSGLADITGEPDGPPVLSGFPIAEGMAALVAAAGIVAALRERTLSGCGQTLEVALYDCAFSTYVAFMPFPLTGQPVTRAGNRHVSSAPWNYSSETTSSQHATSPPITLAN